jgi:hypothetical protein
MFTDHLFSGGSREQSLPAMMFSQNCSGFIADGKAFPIPTMAIAGLVCMSFLILKS